MEHPAAWKAVARTRTRFHGDLITLRRESEPALLCATATAHGVAATTTAAAPTTAAAATATATTTVAAAFTDKSYDTGSGIAFQDRHRGCLGRPR